MLRTAVALETCNCKLRLLVGPAFSKSAGAIFSHLSSGCPRTTLDTHKHTTSSRSVVEKLVHLHPIYLNSHWQFSFRIKPQLTSCFLCCHHPSMLPPPFNRLHWNLPVQRDETSKSGDQSWHALQLILYSGKITNPSRSPPQIEISKSPKPKSPNWILEWQDNYERLPTAPPVPLLFLPITIYNWRCPKCNSYGFLGTDWDGWSSCAQI